MSVAGLGLIELAQTWAAGSVAPNLDGEADHLLPDEPLYKELYAGSDRRFSSAATDYALIQTLAGCEVALFDNQITEANSLLMPVREALYIELRSWHRRKCGSRLGFRIRYTCPPRSTFEDRMVELMRAWPEPPAGGDIEDCGYLGFCVMQGIRPDWEAKLGPLAKLAFQLSINMMVTSSRANFRKFVSLSEE